MASGRGEVFLPLLIVVIAGCVQPQEGGDGNETAQPRTEADAFVDAVTGTIDYQAIAKAIGEPIDLLHDHRDPAFHTGAFNIEFVSYNSLGVELGVNGFANFVFYEDNDEKLAFVAIDGDSTGGFVIVDISDPLHLRPLGRYTIQGNSVQEVRVFPGGKYAVMNVQRQPNATQFGDVEGGKDCTICLQIVDVSDRMSPQYVSGLPVEIVGSHNMHIQQYGSDIYVFYVAQPTYQPGIPASNPPVGNYVGIARFVEDSGGASLVKVAEYHHADSTADQKRSFPHDAYVAKHPVTGKEVLYVSHWEGGAITVDVSNPLAPMELAVNKDPAPSEVSNMHWFAPEPTARPDGKVIAWSAPEIQVLRSGSGMIRAYDVTDPSKIIQVGVWTLPGNVIIPGQFLTSPHITDVDFGRKLLAVSHYHAGVWVLDISDPTMPRALGYYIPHGDPEHPYAGPIWWKKPNFDKEGFMPNVYQSRWDAQGRLWVTERGTGMYVLNYTGPTPS
ncbi:MAG: hypothetical protein HY556_06240 [Euryarchaeota archaeon]|nr:hypothetical protein [Euryarchaeota archaeon]